MTGRVYIVEGPDGGGKSTLVQTLHDRLKSLGRAVKIAHHGPYLEEARIGWHYFHSMRDSLIRGVDVIFDRCWLSEPIYGKVMRHGLDRISGAEKRMLDRAALTCDGVIILCATEKERMLTTWESRKGGEYPDARSKISAIIDAYAQLPNASRALPLIAFDYAKKSFEDLWAELEYFRDDERLLPAPLAGFAHASILILGDRANHDSFTRPFFSFLESGCSWWLADQLNVTKTTPEELIPEQKLLWANAYDAEGEPNMVIARYANNIDHVFLLGDEAKRWYNDHWPKPFLDTTVHKHKHPMYWKRFQYKHLYPLVTDLQATIAAL